MAEQTFKKNCDYGEEHNFFGENEIMVTITLAEYRELIRENEVGRRKLMDSYGKDAEIQHLRDENKFLRKLIEDLTEKSMPIDDEDASDESDS